MQNLRSLVSLVEIKFCGFTDEKDALQACSLGIDFIGFNFVKESKRFVSPEKAKEIISALPERVKKVGVFADEPVQRVNFIKRYCGLDMLQFHGFETPEYCSQFRNYIKAFRVKDADSLEAVSKYGTEYVLLDTFVEDKLGGTGKRFNWAIAKEVLDKKVFLAGGLNYNNVAQAIEESKPFAVDVASGIESAAGRKDLDLMRKFVEAVKGIEA